MRKEMLHSITSTTTGAVYIFRRVVGNLRASVWIISGGHDELGASEVADKIQLPSNCTYEQFIQCCNSYVEGRN